MSICNEHDDACPVCGGQDIENTDCIMSADWIEVVYECPDCGATFHGMYMFDRFENVEPPNTFDGIIRAAIHLGYENPDDITERADELVKILHGMAIGETHEGHHRVHQPIR